MKATKISQTLQNIETQVNDTLTSILMSSEQKLKNHDQVIQSLEIQLRSLSNSILSEKNTLASLSHIDLDPSNSAEAENLAVQSSILSFYESNLGLKIEKISPYTLDFTFYHISQTNSDYHLRLHLQPSNQYSVLECTPPIPSLPSLLRDLNTSNNISLFIKSIRRSFKSLTLP
jgi:hypothetical protein